MDSVKRLLLRESQVQPLLLVLEDLHWIDTETQALLDSLVESLPTARVLLLVNYRPEYEHRWGSKTYYVQLRLDPLPPENADELLHVLLGADTGLQPLKQLLTGQTQGNPFFLEESVRSLVETQVLVGERGAYRLVEALPSIQVPATVQAVLSARIDRLPSQEKGLLQAASVVGEDVPFTLLQAIAELPDDELRRGLTHLQAAEFLYEASLFPELEYTFKHGLTYQVAYGSVLQERRRTLHARIVEALERLYPDRLIEHVERLAHHAFRGEVWTKAVGYLRQAGAKALARSAGREAAAYFEQALEALDHLPETRETRAEAVDLRIDLRHSLYVFGELKRVFGYLHDAEGLARALDDPRRLGWVLVYMCHYSYLTGHSMEARTFGERAQAMAEKLADLPLKVIANQYLGAAYFSSGDYRRAIDFGHKTLQWLEGDLSRERFGQPVFPAVLARFFLVNSLAARGEFDQGIAHGQEGVRIAEVVDHPYSLTTACYSLGYLYGIKGEFNHAVRVLERGLALAREWNFKLLAPGITGFLGHAYACSGRVAEGLSLLEEALDAMESIGAAFHHSLLVVQLGEASVLACRFGDALEQAQRARALAHERGQRGWEAWALRLLGELAARYDPLDVETAEGYYQQTLALAEELGMRPLMAHCHLGLGNLYGQTGDRTKAHGYLTSATTMYGEMDMGFWLAQAKAALGPLG